MRHDRLVIACPNGYKQASDPWECCEAGRQYYTIIMAEAMKLSFYEAFARNPERCSCVKPFQSGSHRAHKAHRGGRGKGHKPKHAIELGKPAIKPFIVELQENLKALGKRSTQNYHPWKGGLQLG